MHVILKSNDLDTARRKNHFGNVLYIKPGTNRITICHLQRSRADCIDWVRGSFNSPITRPRIVNCPRGMRAAPTKMESASLLRVKRWSICFSKVHFARRLSRRRNALQIIEMAKTLNRPVTANHANAIGVYDDRRRNEQCLGGCKSRNHTDEVICAIARGGGTIGVTPVRFMFAPTFDETYYAASENDFLRHLDYVAKALTCKDGRRNIDMTHHVSLGSDTSMNGYDKRLKWLHMRMANRYNGGSVSPLD